MVMYVTAPTEEEVSFIEQTTPVSGHVLLA
jgi:hypothetical protein